MKKIIVPVDFSEHSEYALKVASSIAKKHNSELFLLHMLDISDQLIGRASGAKQQELLFLMQLAKKRFDDLLESDYLEGVNVTPVVKQYRVFEEINNVAEEIEADLVVMGSQGASGLKGYFVGSNTEKVVRTSEVPVLVIKSDLKYIQFKNIVFASDFTEENIPAFSKIKKLAASFGAQLKLVYINTPSLKFKSTYEIREQMRSFLSAAQIPSSSTDLHIYSDYIIEEGIKNAAEDLKADLIAIPTHGRKGIDKLLSGSIGEDVANTSDIPVLTIKL